MRGARPNRNWLGVISIATVYFPGVQCCFNPAYSISALLDSLTFCILLPSMHPAAYGCLLWDALLGLLCSAIVEGSARSRFGAKALGGHSFNP